MEGNRELTAGEIVTCSGIAAGTNIFKTDLRAAKARIETLPAVKEAQVFRELPARVVIRVKERKPLALVPAKEGFIAVDADGVHVRSARIGEKGLPVLTGLNLDEIPPPGGLLPGGDIPVLLRVIEGLPTEVVNSLSEVHREKDGRIVLYTLQGVRCLLGGPEDVQKKGELLLSVLKELKGRRIEYIDLSLPGSPVVKMG
ncbi:MAG: FtsQ-type POTRA domain-containing protein [Peptococcaceae bacterium]|nr:FtsQ-type POTRA domain-containing protein [Peptococcaceae bacterium]